MTIYPYKVNLGLYIHIPFCSRRCDYCDFATWVDREDMVEKYIDTILTQWKLHRDRGELDQYKSISTIFFGGGTPNLIEAHHIAKIIEALSKTIPLLETSEITLEANPDHVTAEKCEIYNSAGINRISLGVQSTQTDVLSFLGREHRPHDVAPAIEIIRSCGISNINCDLIYGSAVESIDQWRVTIEDVVSLSPQHISAYALGIEPGTPLGRDVASNLKSATNDEDLADKYLLADEVLSSRGYEWYEISNWAQPGKESAHNKTYWLGGDVIGLGCAAHGYTNGQRWSTPRNIDTYIERFSSTDSINRDELFIMRDDSTNISLDEEKFALALRTRGGVEYPHDASLVNDLVDEGLIYREGNSRVVLTPRGRLVAHDVSLTLFDQITSFAPAVE